MLSQDHVRTALEPNEAAEGEAISWDQTPLHHLLLPHEPVMLQMKFTVQLPNL